MRTPTTNRRALSICAVAFALAGCGGSQPPIGTPGAMPLINSGAKAQHRIYVANGWYPGGSVTVYGLHAEGNVNPIQTITGSKTGMVGPSGIAVDAAGNIYVTDPYAGPPSQLGTVFVYAAGASGNAKPIATITKDLNSPSCVAVDGGGNIYVGNFEGADVTVYAAGTYALMRVISLESGRLGYVAGVAVDRTGKTYVVNSSYSGDSSGSYGESVYVFAAGTDRLIRTITGANTGLTSPGGIAVNAVGKIFVTNFAYRDKPEILVFAPGANGNAKPTRIIRGPKTQVLGPGIALSAHGTIFVANFGYYGSSSNTVTVYAGGARGDAAPIRQIGGSHTDLNTPAGITVR